PRLALKEIKADVYYNDKVIDSIDVIKNGKKNENEPLLQEWIFKDTLNIEDIKDKNVQENILFKFKLVDNLGREYELERNFIEFIAH
ncbi:hypothetical protein GOQ27_08455, partial [Clostridium sp. D2Q-11]